MDGRPRMHGVEGPVLSAHALAPYWVSVSTPMSADACIHDRCATDPLIRRYRDEARCAYIALRIRRGGLQLIGASGRCGYLPGARVGGRRIGTGELPVDIEGHRRHAAGIGGG